MAGCPAEPENGYMKIGARIDMQLHRWIHGSLGIRTNVKNEIMIGMRVDRTTSTDIMIGMGTYIRKDLCMVMRIEVHEKT